MSAKRERADDVKVAGGNRACYTNLGRFSSVDQMPFRLVVSRVAQHAKMFAEFFWTGRDRVILEVRRRSGEVANTFSDPLGDQARVLQIAKANRHVDILRNQVHEHIGELEVHLDMRIARQEGRQEVVKRLLLKHDGPRDA